MKQGNPADIVYDYIKNQIVTKAIYPGTRIVEEDLVRETGVSRTPVRSALMRLAYDGLIQQQPNRGAVVAMVMLAVCSWSDRSLLILSKRPDS